MAMPLGLWCHYWFHDFLLGFFLSCLLCFGCLGNWLGKEEINGTQGELCRTQQVMKDLNEVGACVRVAKGKSMIVG